MVTGVMRMGLKLCEGGTLGSHNAVIWGARHLCFIARPLPRWRHLEWPWLPGSTIAAKPFKTFQNVSPPNTTSAAPFRIQLVELVIPDNSKRSSFIARHPKCAPIPVSFFMLALHHIDEGLAIKLALVCL